MKSFIVDGEQESREESPLTTHRSSSNAAFPTLNSCHPQLTKKAVYDTFVPRKVAESCASAGESLYTIRTMELSRKT
jgi:hypothetical protein